MGFGGSSNHYGKTKAICAIFGGHRQLHGHQVKIQKKIERYIEYQMHFDFKQWLRFSISIPNYTYCTRNPFKCLFAVLKYSDVSMGKYQRLKERTRKLDMWRQL